MPVGILREPSFQDPLFLFEHLMDAPETGKATAPVMVEPMKEGIKREATVQSSPKARKTSQTFFPQRYSHRMTIGWKIPMHRKTAAPMMMPLKFMPRSFEEANLRRQWGIY